MKKIKKVAVSNIPAINGAVVDSFNAGVDKTTNAPSIRAVEEILENYSIEQRITTGQECATNEWIDGKQVYRKRINTGGLPNATNKAIQSDLDLSMITVIKIEGIARALNNTTIPLPFTTLTNEGCIALSIQSTGYIHIQTGSDRSNYYDSYVDLYYTKNDKRMIAFTIAGNSYVAEEDMTWEQFVNSSYNTDNAFKLKDYTEGSSTVYHTVEDSSNTRNHVAYFLSGSSGGYDYVNYTNVIDANKTYFWGTDKF